jgi:eukaryotic-like serine/threonine-protein kinase
LATDYAARGDGQKARETLEPLLNLWKDADPDLPLLKKAKTEYAKLQ